jgi:hypothetical protein
MQRGICVDCQAKEGRRVSIDRVATPEKLRENPDWAELEATLEGWYGEGGDPDHDAPDVSG